MLDFAKKIVQAGDIEERPDAFAAPAALNQRKGRVTVSDTATTPSQADDSAARHVQTYKFTVDGRNLESEQAILTGAQIKAKASVDPSFGLFLEGHGHKPDEQITDNQNIDLREPGREKFYTAPPATFGRTR